MFLPLLLACALLGSVQASTLAPSLSDSGPRPAATLEELTAELARVVQSSVGSATTGSLQRIAESLNAIQRGLASVSDRLDLLNSSQLRLEETQSNVSSRLEALQESNAEILDRLNHAKGCDEISPGTSSRDADAGNTLHDVSSASTVVAGSGSQLQETAGQDATSERPTTAITTAATTTPTRRVVLAHWCLTDSDCTPLQPETECGDRRRCSCRPGYRQVSMAECRRLSGLSESCTEDADCKIPDSECSGGICNCTSRFWNNGNENCRRLSRSPEGGSCVDDPDCNAEEGLQCISGKCTCKTTVHGQYEFRVAGGGSCSRGRAELRLAGGRWGFICDDSFGHTDATVFCRSLRGYNFTSGSSLGGGQHGRGENFYMDDVNCDGSERHVLRCAYPGWGEHNCGSGEVVSVSCSDP